MNRLNKVIYATVATALLISTGVMAASVGTMNTFSSGTPAVANDVNANFTEQTTQINDNDSRLFNLENNFGKIFSSVSYMHIPNLAVGVAGTTIVELFFSNSSTTTCKMYFAKSQRNWKLGDNEASLFAPALTYSAATLGGKTSTGGVFTTVLFYGGSSIGDISIYAFVGYTVRRDETNVLDTCGPNDVLLHGARVYDPNGNVHFIPLSEMKVK